ncbi:MAG: DUF4232 domain-containing protein, partial [Solirubrobacteraceae bacterium]
MTRRRGGRGAAAVIVLLAVLPLAAVSRSATPATAGSRPTVASNRALARTLAAELLGRVPVPAGAEQVARNPGIPIWLDSSASGVPVVHVADVHRFWRVAGDPKTVFDQIRAHPPAGARVALTGTGSRNGTPVAWSLVFSYPPVPGRILERGVGVGVTSARAGGTAVRADGYAVWQIPRPASEVVPAAARTVAVSIDRDVGSGFPVGTVSARRTVARLVSFVDSRPVAQGLAQSCPEIGPSTRVLDLRFEGTEGGPPLARAVETACGGLSFFIHGRRQRPLDEGGDLSDLLWDLGALPACRADQLSETETRPSREPRAIVAELVFHNISDSACALKGFGRVRLIGADGGVLSPPVRNAPGVAPVMLLTPTDTSFIALSWAAPSPSCHAPRPAEI